MKTKSDLTVLLLYNLDTSWPAADKGEILRLVDLLACALRENGHAVSPVALEADELQVRLSGYDPQTHVVFNWCEEIPGMARSAGFVARELERLGYTFTGADSRTLQASYDKPAIKDHMNAVGIPTPNWTVFRSAEDLDWSVFPAIVKPAYEHCSYGITRKAVVHDSRELALQVEEVISAYDQPVLVEDFIDGREFHVTVVGNGRLEVFPVAEMDFSRIAEDRGRLCTYDSKFVPDSPDYQLIQLRLPAELPAAEMDHLEAIALAAYRATGCRDYARLDIRQRDGEFYVLDVNPNADISPDTSVPMAAELAGYSYGQFGSLLVNLAAHRHPYGLGKLEFSLPESCSPQSSVNLN
jgi:D-alanine-D-alanine ligase